MVLSGSFMVHFGSVGSSFALWTLIVCLSSAVWTSSEGQPRVVGSLQPIVAFLGNDVILPCRLQPSLNLEGLTVEWSKPDLKPDPSDRLSRVDYVHLYRDRREDMDMKLQSYIGRTELSKDGLKSGDISLKILNVTLEDGGRYRCFIPKLKGPVKESVVTLVVEPNSVQTTTETPPDPRDLQTPDPNNETNVRAGRSHLGALIVVVVWVLLVLGGGVGGYLLKHKKQQELLKYDDAPNKPLPV
ncbi:selection and upkeep of intraepithelial T-cells protein 1-like isoform X3 [Dicentrarchus labrax]|uniref:selection and upkeep of intraepithelial T-cells protein 1-like isoform X3 n=1 Tax=Dicentrarchus labrax TaxID=13489 RepID=UPI0021F5FB2B|nr:selection and upkeep of intraepithelial T-cells protein 1-like isoform X3 [Dicentrarchus labrax]